jgi:hypothetical protein
MMLNMAEPYGRSLLGFLNKPGVLLAADQPRPTYWVT